MRFSTIVTGVLAAATSVFASPILAPDASEVGHVTDGEGKIYALQNTGMPNIRVITEDRKDGYYIRPVSYHVDANRACKFYSEATHGVGYLIGEFKGPVDADFGTHWAAFYECWDSRVSKSNNGAIIDQMPCGLVTTGEGVRINLGLVERPISFTVNGEYVKAVSYRTFDGCNCSFYNKNGRGGPVAGVETTGAQSGEFELPLPYRYSCALPQ